MGYRLGTIATDGHVVMIGAGTAHGIAALDDTVAPGPVPFTSSGGASISTSHRTCTRRCVSSPLGQPVPQIGDRVDVQRPLTMTQVDEFEWL